MKLILTTFFSVLCFSAFASNNVNNCVLASLYGHHVWIIQDSTTFVITHEDVECKECMAKFGNDDLHVKDPTIIIEACNRYEVKDVKLNNHDYWKVTDKKTGKSTLVHNYNKCIKCENYFD